MARILSKRFLGLFYSDVNSSLHSSPAALSLNSKRFESYKAAVLHEYGEPLTIEERKSKKLKKGEVRVKVRYAGVNVSDVMFCKGDLESHKPKLPFVPGYEISGEISEVKPDPLDTKLDFAVGDRIVALSKTDFSGFAEECVVSLKDCWHIPSSVKYKHAAVLADNYATALIGLSRRANLKDKDIVLILAGSGGLGLAAVDVAANVYRAKVIGVCDTADKATLIRDKGAWTALTYEPKFMYKTVMEMTEKKGVRIAMDSVGGPMCQHLVRCVANEGNLIVAGTAAFKTPSFLTSALLPNSICLMGVTLGNYRKTAPNIYRQIVQDAVDMCEQKLIAPSVAKEFSLADINSAFKFTTDKQSTAKAVIKVLD